MKNGTTVSFTTRGGRKATGVIDKRSDLYGFRMYRVNDRWFLPEALTVV